MRQNYGPCKVENCKNNDPNTNKFRTFTEDSKNKAIKHKTYEDYNYLKIGDQLCHPHYLSIVVPNRGNDKKRRSGDFGEIFIVDDDDSTEFKLSHILENSSDNVEENFDYWSDININNHKDKVSLSNENFDLLINKIKEIQKQLNDYKKNKINEFNEKIKLLSQVLYQRQRQLNLDIELDPEKFKDMIEKHDMKLKGFFDELVDIFLPSNRSTHTIDNAKKSLVGFCYLLTGLRNKFNNSLQLEIGLYLFSCGATTECIDVMSRLGISVSYKSVDRYKKKITSGHLPKINQYFEENKNKLFCFNIDDYHSIHSFRQPNTTTLSTAHHMATCVSKTIKDSIAISADGNGVPIHNPENIEDWRINDHLIKYINSLSNSYNLVKLNWLKNNVNTFKQFDRIELLRVHSYDDAIEERQEDRSMMDCYLINIKEQNLKSLDDYLNALKMITDIPSLNNYLQYNVIPIVADFPGQLFIRRAITLLRKQKNNPSTQIPEIVNNFIPILGPLHVSLNMREDIILVHWHFFERMFKSVFGKNKKLAKRPKPTRINLLLELASSGWKEIAKDIFHKFGPLCKDVEFQTLIDLLDNLIPAALDVYSIIFRSGSCDQYVDTIFRLWTFALRWERKNYNKIPLAFLSDYFYWKDNNHPFLEAIQSHLVNFNDYYVENWHSRIRRSTTSHHSSDAIISQAFILDSNELTLFNSFRKFKSYPYKESTLNYLKYKSSLFLIDYFHQIYQNLGKSKKINNRKNEYEFATLNEKVKLKCLPAGYHSSKTPSNNTCDYCNQIFIVKDEQEGIMLICGHAYHHRCFGEKNNRCDYCLEYYKKGVVSNVNSYINRLEKDNVVNDNLLLDEIVDEENEDDNNDEYEITEDERISLDFRNALVSINNW